MVGLLTAACYAPADRELIREMRYTARIPLWSTSADSAYSSADISSALVIDSTIIILESSAASISGVAMGSWKPLWQTGRRGAGPGEFQMPRTLIAFGDSTFGVLDSFAAQVLLFGSNGKYERSIGGQLYEREVDDVCNLGAGRLIASRFPRSELVRAESSGFVSRQAGVRWPEPKLDSAIQLKQARFARQRTTGHVCLLYTVRGNYFAEVDAETLRLGDAFTYAEPIRVPELTREKGVVSIKHDMISGAYAVVTDTLLYVLYGGASRAAQKQVDAYSRANYQYQWSIQLPRTASQFDVVGDRIVVLEVGENDVRQVAVYLLASPPSARRESTTNGERR